MFYFYFVPSFFSLVVNLSFKCRFLGIPVFIKRMRTTRQCCQNVRVVTGSISEYTIFV